MGGAEKSTSETHVITRICVNQNHVLDCINKQLDCTFSAPKITGEKGHIEESDVNSFVRYATQQLREYTDGCRKKNWGQRLSPDKHSIESQELHIYLVKEY